MATKKKKVDYGGYETRNPNTGELTGSYDATTNTYTTNSGKTSKGSPLSNPTLADTPAVNTAAGSAADARNIATYGTARPTNAMILNRLYNLQKGDIQSKTGEEAPLTMSPAEAAALKNQTQPNLGKPTNAEMDALTPTGNPLDIAGAIGGGIAGAAGGAGLGAGIGAGIGSIVPGAGTAAGAAIGGVIGGAIGFAGGFATKITLDERQNVKESLKVFSTGKDNRANILANMQYMTRQQAIDAWENSALAIYASERNLKTKTKDMVTDFLGDPGEELIEVTAYMKQIPADDVNFQLKLNTLPY